MSGRRIAAMVVNDNAYEMDKRGALESIASKLAPTVWRSHHSTWSLVGAGLPAMVVNDYACELNKRGALESIAGKPAPTVWRSHHSTRTRSLVGAGLPAMVVNDNAYGLDKRGALESIAGKPALTVSRDCVKNHFFLMCAPMELKTILTLEVFTGEAGVVVVTHSQ